MNVVGKILAFLNLAFSIVVAALVIMIYMTRANFANENKKVVAELQIMNGQVAAYKAAAEDIHKEYEAKYKSKSDQTDVTEQKLAAQEQALQGLRQEVAKLTTAKTELERVVTQTKTEVQKRQTDVEQLRDTLKMETERTIELTKENNVLRDQKVAAEIAYRSTMDTNNRLVAQLQEREKVIARLQNNQGTTATASRLSTDSNPPPENIEGLIKGVDPATQLFTITLGSDAGLKKDHTLELVRLNLNSPKDSKYLGRIRIIDVRATEAVGRPVTPMKILPTPGDMAISRILGS